MTNLGLRERGKILISISLLINVVLVLVVVWLLMRHGVEGLLPSSGKTDYLIAVNAQDEPRIYTPNGIPWEFCKEGECNDLPDDISCELGNWDGFVLVNFSRAHTGARPINKTAAMSDMIVPPAFAEEPDGECTRIGYKKIGSTLVAQYPPTSVDPDCPPKSK